MAGSKEPRVTRRQIQVLLTLHDGERSFGMSLAQKTSALGSKYTVVSSVFAKSPADRAGVRKGYVVQRINDEPMDGLTVAQVANHFRNIGQARITLEVRETAVPPKKPATFKGVATLSMKHGERLNAPGTGNAVATSGRAIAAPGSALAGPKLVAPKQQLVRRDTKPAAKLVSVQPPTGLIPSASANMASTAVRWGHAGAAIPNTDAKIASGVSYSGLESKSVAPITGLAKPVQQKLTATKVAKVTTTIDPAAKSVPGILSNISATETYLTNSNIPKTHVELIQGSSVVASAQVGKEYKETVTAAQSKNLLAPTSPRILEAAAMQTASVSAVSLTVAASNPTSVPSSLSIKATRVALKTATRNASLQPVSHPSSATESTVTVLNSSSASRVETTAVKPQCLIASEVNTANPEKWPAKSLSSPPATIALVSATTPPESAMQIPLVHIPEPALVTAMPPNEVMSRSKAGLAKRRTSTPVRSTTQITTVAFAPVPQSPVTIPVPPTTTKAGKKRRRQRTSKATAGTTSNKGKGKAKKTAKQQQEVDGADGVVEDEDVFGYYAFTSDSSLEESPSKKASCRTPKVRRRAVTDRTRQSLTIVRLVDMGFKKEDAEASVKEIGDDPDACMVWIISKIEERQFYEDLNRASIQSERSKHDEEKRVRKLEKEKLAHADKFMGIFPTSYMVCAESTASRFKDLLLSTIDQVHGSSYLREALSELLKLEGKSIRWYKEASRSYMVELAKRLDAALRTHDVMTCCARASASNVSSPNGCEFVREILEEIKALTTALFEMPTNQGGVPQVFLECDEATHFHLEDDGFEVVESND